MYFYYSLFQYESLIFVFSGINSLILHAIFYGENKRSMCNHLHNMWSWLILQFISDLITTNLNLKSKFRMSSNGIVVEHDDKIINLDPKHGTENAVSFVSHAHLDHLHNQRGRGILIASKPTTEIAKLRGYSIENYVEEYENFSMIDAGHILGAKGLLFDDVFYTGDISTRDRGFMKGAITPKCKTLITECTFGIPEFIFPSISETVKKVNEIISDLYGKGKPVILLGYELGKAQVLAYLFSNWQPYYHDSVKKVNDLYRQFGIHLYDSLGHTQAESQGLLEKKPWLMIAPNMNNKNSFLKHMKSKYDAITIAFSGWAQSSRFSFARGHDYSIPLSDHCDYSELINLVKRCKPEKIYTVHGFVDEFAADMVKMGYDAQPLKANSLDEFT
jgi:putative mRNA 3-end processing factor